MTAVLVVALLLLAPGSPHAQPAPAVTITQPTTAPTWSTTATLVTLAGTATASGQRSIRDVRWHTDRGESGVAQGTTAWSLRLPVPLGTTRVTVTATDTRSRMGTDALTITVLAGPPPPGPITVEWSFSGTGEAFQLERCTVPCGPMAPVAALAITERTWVDQSVRATEDYCYRLAVLTGSTIGPYSNTMCSP